MTSFTCMTNNVKSRHNHFSDCHWFRANRDDAMEKQGIASIAILPSGSISGHFVDTRTSECLGIFGTQIECERECSRGEDYKLIDLCILEFQSKKEVRVVVESHGQDAARFQNATNIHGWERHVVDVVQIKDSGVTVPEIKFECQILKADEDAERHVQKYLPSLIGRGAVVNVGTMTIKDLNFGSQQSAKNKDLQQDSSINGQIDEADTTNSHDNGAEAFECVEEEACQTSSRVSVNRKGTSSGCMLLGKQFIDILQEELEMEGLSEHRFHEEKIP